MSLRSEPIGTIPAETARVARAAFRKGTVVMRLRDEFSALYEDEDFAALYPARGQPGLAPWRLALITVLQFLEHLSDRQAADAVRARIDWKYALGLELIDPGFHFSVLAEFRARLVAGNAEHLLLDRMLERFKTRGLVKARGKQRTDSTHVLAAVHDLHLLELVGEALRATLDDLAAAVPHWLRTVAPPGWFERYARRIEEYRLPRGREAREALALEIGADGFLLLAALDAPATPAEARAVPMVRTLREVWRVHYAGGDDGHLRWRKIEELPPVAERMQSPHDLEAHFSRKRDHGVSLEGPVRCTSSRPARAGQGYDLPHFAIDWDHEQVTCPQGKTSVSWHRERVGDGETRICAQFSRTDCKPCAARDLCAPATAARRAVHFHRREEYEALNAARARMSDPAWQERYHRRAGVEGTLSQG